MADFVQKSITKSAVRELTTPIADANALNTIVNNFISGNPLGCTSYEVAGVTMDPVAKTRESYNVRIAYENDEAKTVGTISARAPTLASFQAVKTNILNNSALATAMGGDAVSLDDRETYSVTGPVPRSLRGGLLPDLHPRAAASFLVRER